MEERIHQLYRTFAPDLFRIARYRLGEDQLAQDLVQEVFLLLLEKAAELQDHPNLQGWLVRTLDYRILHALQKRDRDLPLLHAETVPAPAGVSLDEVLPKQLSQDERRLLKLFYEDGHSYEELSVLLGLSPAACGTRLHRARLKCRRYLEQKES